MTFRPLCKLQGSLGVKDAKRDPPGAKRDILVLFWGVHFWYEISKNVFVPSLFFFDLWVLWGGRNRVMYQLLVLKNAGWPCSGVGVFVDWGNRKGSAHFLKKAGIPKGNLRLLKGSLDVIANA